LIFYKVADDKDNGELSEFWHDAQSFEVLNELQKNRAK
jgi:hypothetical protein